jgi:tripartite-type tricarboxylate transporter receptor subunit TctC
MVTMRESTTAGARAMLMAFADCWRIAAAASQALQLAELKTALAAQGFEPLVATPEQFDAFYRGEVPKWGKVVQTVGLTSE